MRRLFWLGIGAITGATGTVWAERKVKAQLDKLGPDHLVVTAGNKAKDVGRNVVDAVAEGRSAMREREVELRDSYDRPGRTVTPHRPPASPAPLRPSTGDWSRGRGRHR